MRAVKVLGLMISVCCLISLGYADSYTFSTIPSNGAIGGAPGETVGWGYSLTNNSLIEWLVTVGISADSFSNGVPTFLFDFPVLSPSSSVFEAYDPSVGAGLMSFTWDSSAPPGFR